MKNFKHGCGCQEPKCPEEKQCGCVIEINTDCVKDDNNKTLTNIILELKERVFKLEEITSLVPKTIVQEFLIVNETDFNTKHLFIPSTVRVYVDGDIFTNFSTSGLNKVVLEYVPQDARVLTIEYKTVDENV